jgi:hypothetical protein
LSGVLCRSTLGRRFHSILTLKGLNMDATHSDTMQYSESGPFIGKLFKNFSKEYKEHDQTNDPTTVYRNFVRFVSGI